MAEHLWEQCWQAISCGTFRDESGNDAYVPVHRKEGRMFEPKPIRKEAIPKALDKAQLYRLLNEPAQAESICSDILQLDLDNQQALITLLLALTDQFNQGLPVNRPQELLA